MSDWTTERLELLRFLFGEGKSFATIARQINAETGSTFTRNAALGKANREGFYREYEKKDKKENRRRHNATPVHIMRRNAVDYRIDLPPEKLPLPEFLGIPFARLDNNASEPKICRFPHGDVPNILFCGQPTQEGSAYCPAHHRMCHTRPQTANERKVHFISS